MYGFDWDAFSDPVRREPRPACPHGKRIKRLVRSVEAREAALPDGDEARIGRALIDAGKAYCVAQCGGCPLTEGWTPPA